MVKSLRWRLQFWHAGVLTAVLAVFGTLVGGLQWRSRLQQIDADLERQAEMISTRVYRLLPPPQFWRGRRGGERRGEDRVRETAPPDAKPGTAPATTAEVAEKNDNRPSRSDQRPPWWNRERTGESSNRSTAPPGLGLPEEYLSLFSGDHGLYFVIWDREGKLLEKSAQAPVVPFPDLHVGTDHLPIRAIRTRDDLREAIHVSRFDTQVLVGRSLQGEVAALWRGMALVAGGGVAALLIGLVGGWWTLGRAIRPIGTMTATAQSISARNLSERINMSETDTELGQLAAVLNGAFDRLEQAFEQQQRFTADASHELRTPLSVILSHVELALNRRRSPEEYRAALEICQRASRRMKSLIDSLLVLARFDSGEPSLNLGQHDLAEIAREAIDLIRPLAEERQISLVLDAAPTVVRCDCERVSQVLMNLLTNAIRYNRDEGQVEVRVAAEGDSGHIRVSDTGEGIPAADLPHVFERFYRVDKARSRSAGGSGLGLAISKSIVEAHGGRIAVESELNHGTALDVWLPGVTKVRPESPSSEVIQAGAEMVSAPEDERNARSERAEQLS